MIKSVRALCLVDRASYSAGGGAKQAAEADTPAQHHERRKQRAGAKQSHVRRHLRSPPMPAPTAFPVAPSTSTFLSPALLSVFGRGAGVV